MHIPSFNQILNYDINITDIVCLEQHWVSSNNNFSYKTKPRENNGIILVLDGSAVYSMHCNNVITASRGDILYLPKGAYYFVKFPHPPSTTILINFFIYDKNGNEINLFENVSKLMSGANGIILDLFIEICDLYLKTSNKLIIKAKLFEIINFIAGQSIRQESTSAVMPAVEYIDNHLNKVIKIPHLARLCAISERTFRREFISFTEMTPTQYIQNKKMKKAKQMLSNGEFSISDICAALGYYDNAHFSKSFKAVTGKTPIQYRNKD